VEQQYQDAIAITQFYKKVDVFMAVTTNPGGVRSCLLPAQTAYGHPDLVSGLFLLKIRPILEVVYRKHASGKTAAYIYIGQSDLS
jgi:hypothetical protein